MRLCGLDQFGSVNGGKCSIGHCQVEHRTISHSMAYLGSQSCSANRIELCGPVKSNYTVITAYIILARSGPLLLIKKKGSRRIINYLSFFFKKPAMQCHYFNKI